MPMKRGQSSRGTMRHSNTFLDPAPFAAVPFLLPYNRHEREKAGSTTSIPRCHLEMPHSIRTDSDWGSRFYVSTPRSAHWSARILPSPIRWPHLEARLDREGRLSNPFTVETESSTQTGITTLKSMVPQVEKGINAPRTTIALACARNHNLNPQHRCRDSEY